jgi:NAD-dependent dihydropyrimidine dehydrogenase PreA subunit
MTVGKMCACGPCCPGKPNTKKLRIGGQEIGISGFDEIIAQGMEHINGSDDDQRKALLAEMKANNYVPDSVEKDYLNAVWEEFKQVRAKRLGQVEERYHGIPREEIPWYPRVDDEKCTGCGSCVEFCQKKVYTLDDKAIVANPYRCVVSCTGCLNKCPEGALSFPTMVELRDIMKALRKKYGIL